MKQLLPAINRTGAGKRRVQEAVRLLEDVDQDGRPPVCSHDVVNGPFTGNHPGEVLDRDRSAAHNIDDINRITAGHSVGLNFDVEDGAFVLTGNTVPSDLELQLQLMAAYITAPGYRPEALDRFFRLVASPEPKLKALSLLKDRRQWPQGRSQRGSARV